MAQQIGTSLREAVREALEKFRQWMDGATVVQFTDGSHDAVPSAYLSDVSYCNRDDVAGIVFHIDDPTELGEWDGEVTDEVLDWVMQWLPQDGSLPMWDEPVDDGYDIVIERVNIALRAHPLPSKRRTYRYAYGDVHATDLQHEIAKLKAHHEKCETGTIVVFEPDGRQAFQPVEYVYAVAAGRVGFAWGADAEWGNVQSGDDLEQAIDDFLNDADAWQARH